MEICGHFCQCCTYGLMLHTDFKLNVAGLNSGLETLETFFLTTFDKSTSTWFVGLIPAVIHAVIRSFIRSCFGFRGTLEVTGTCFFMLSLFVRLWRITKKLVPVKSSRQSETRTIANSGRIKRGERVARTRRRIRQSLTIGKSIFGNSRFFLQSLKIGRSIFDNL